MSMLHLAHWQVDEIVHTLFLYQLVYCDTEVVSDSLNPVYRRSILVPSADGVLWHLQFILKLANSCAVGLANIFDIVFEHFFLPYILWLIFWYKFVIIQSSY